MRYGHYLIKTMSDQCSCKNLINLANISESLNIIKSRGFESIGGVPNIWDHFVRTLKFIVLGAVMLGLINCSSIEKTTVLGLTVGASTGAIMEQGLNVNADQKSTIRRSVVGGLVGAGLGYLLHRIMNTREDRVRKETLFNLEAHGIDQGFKPVTESKYGSFVTSPDVKEDYIETHTTDDGRVLIQGHKRWVLIGSPQFSLPKPSKE